MNNKVYDISGKKKIWFIISLALIAAIAVITVIKGVEIAIEFKGGTIISYSYEGDASIKDAQSEIEDLLKTPVVIQEGENLSNDSNSFSISFSYETGASSFTDITSKAQTITGIHLFFSSAYASHRTSGAKNLFSWKKKKQPFDIDGRST